MSNRKRLPRQQVPDDVRAAAAEARCSDCPGTARVRSLRDGYEIKVIHSESCPAYQGSVGTLHADAARSVARAAARTGHQLAYQRVDDVRGEVTGVSGKVTTGS